MNTRPVSLAIAAALVGMLAACGSAATPEAAPSQGSDQASPQKLTVLAAASLKSTFTDLATTFESTHPGTDVELSFAGSSDLVSQLTAGAPGDVFASADEKNMTKAVDGGVVVSDSPKMFATNTLTIVTPPGNPKKVATFADLARTDLQTVICAPQVPCGSATKKVAEAAGVTVHAVSEENAVTDVLGKVTSGQADAGLVYVTDAAGAGDKVTAVPFPEAATAINRYPIAVTKEAVNPALAAEFVDLVTSEAGQNVLREAGFGSPQK
ncbi:molybdate ABC transporter substrate-binding protein [Gephyromycinifex aptenodytis]|uniref:molybdate ABC transporter substrate-binding protein n=1 Tax=Gephyromycinifex aptenodytis TaxID=2716227 RepID=UPI001B2FF51E|nr:molybdate ABC transporter substrate-binding protein [Gephyromycinifex aptenodytis]